MYLPLIIILIIAYFYIGNALIDFLAEDNDVWSMVIYIAWPAVIVVILIYLIVKVVFEVRDLFNGHDSNV